MKSRVSKIQNAVAMQNFAAKLARRILKESSSGTMRPHSTATVIALVGNLGAGKTTFTQGFLKALGVKRRIISPTFLIIRPYDIKAGEYTRAFHMDCYRLNNSIELLSLGLRDILKDPQNIVLIEWPELIKKELPKDTQWIEISHPKKGTHREVRLVG